MAHPLIDQLRFTRSEFLRGIKHIGEGEACRRFLPMNCISWNVGHLAWQEQRYFLYYRQEGRLLLPEIDKNFAYGAPASTPSITEMLAAWQTITRAADPWLDAWTTEKLLQNVIRQGKPREYTYGNLLQRVIYHYWYHLGETMAIRQMLGHRRLAQFVGDIDTEAPYRPELLDNLSLSD
jgi:hypothetical protein